MAVLSDPWGTLTKGIRQELERPPRYKPAREDPDGHILELVWMDVGGEG
jgi:predicted lactoylglutathione lyase